LTLPAAAATVRTSGGSTMRKPIAGTVIAAALAVIASA
jgi:hypothetical protein